MTERELARELRRLKARLAAENGLAVNIKVFACDDEGGDEETLTYCSPTDTACRWAQCKRVCGSNLTCLSQCASFSA